jgi:hypothetical protein
MLGRLVLLGQLEPLETLVPLEQTEQQTLEVQHLRLAVEQPLETQERLGQEARLVRQELAVLAELVDKVAESL